MKRQYRGKFEFVFALVLGAASACTATSGTSTGNPMENNGGGPGTPEGAKFLKSELVRESPALDASDSAALGTGNRAFAFDLYRKLAGDSSKNLFFSPFSISVALAMTYPGANGQTEAELGSTLHFDLPESALHPAFNATLRALDGRAQELSPSLVEETTGTGFQLSIVNQAWGQQGYPFLGSYLDVLAQNYGAGLFSVQFADSENTRQRINGWVADQTQDRVQNLLPVGALTSDTRFVLTNAIYFKGSWLVKFDPDKTTDGVFHAPAADRSVRMMHNFLDARFAEGAGYRALELPYLSPAVRMVLVLPDGGNLQSLATDLQADRFQEILQKLSQHEVQLSLPKFTFESENPLKGPLKALGMVDPFTSSADFSDIAGGVEELFIDEVYHKAFVAVDEVGTEAAAATAVVGSTVSAKPQAEITFDRPFLFAIYDAPTGQILFLGNVVDPR